MSGVRDWRRGGCRDRRIRLGNCICLGQTGAIKMILALFYSVQAFEKIAVSVGKHRARLKAKGPCKHLHCKILQHFMLDGVVKRSIYKNFP